MMKSRREERKDGGRDKGKWSYKINEEKQRSCWKESMIILHEDLQHGAY